MRYGGTSLNYGVLLSNALIKRSCHIRGAFREGGVQGYLLPHPPTHFLEMTQALCQNHGLYISLLTFCFPLPSTCLPLRLLLIPPHHTLVRHVLSLNAVISHQITDFELHRTLPPTVHSVPVHFFHIFTISLTYYTLQSALCVYLSLMVAILFPSVYPGNRGLPGCGGGGGRAGD